MITVVARRRTVSWAGTLPPVESVVERTDRFYLPLPEPTPPPQCVGTYRNDLPTLLRVLDGLEAL